MVASFSASNQVGEMMKKQNRKLKPKTDEHPSTHQAPPASEPEPEV